VSEDKFVVEYIFLLFTGVFGKFYISVVFYITGDQKKTRFFSFDFPSDVRFIKYNSVSHKSIS